MIYGTYVIESIAFAFLMVLALISLVYWLSRRAGPVKAGTEKRSIYAGGEDIPPEEMNVMESGFFTAAGRSLGIEKLRNLHNGDLSNYLAWIFIGMIALIMVMVMAW